MVTSGELQLGLVSAGDPISKELDCFGRPCRLAAPTWRHHPGADLAKDALSVAWVAHVIEVIQRNAEVPHVRNIDVGKQRPDVLREANCHRPTPISVSSDTESHSLDWSVSAEVPLAAGWQDQRWTLARIRDLVAARFGVAHTIPGIWYLLRRCGWTCQIGACRAIERDDDAVEMWKKETWPRIKGPRRPSAAGSSSKTNAASR